MSVTTDTSISFPSIYVVHNAQGGPSVTPADDTGQLSSVTTAYRTRTGQRLPKWKSIIVGGGNATTPLTARWDAVWSERANVSYNLSYPDGSWAKREGRGDVVFTNGGVIKSLGSPTLGPTASGSAADNRARARFYKRLRTLQVQFSGPTFLGELRETLRMIRRPAQAIRDSCDRYYLSLAKWKGRNRPPASSHQKWVWRQELQKVAGGLWLENSFGWQPLLNDIKDAVTAYERLTPRLANRRVISVGDTDSVDRRNEAMSFGFGDGSSVWSSGIFFKRLCTEAKESIIVRYKGSVTVSTDADHWDNAALFGFTPSEFIPTAWELLPWSFLIDYFTNIGDILSASVTRSSNVNFVNKTARSTITLNGVFIPDSEKTRLSLGANWKITGGGNSVHWSTQRKSITRSAGSGVPLPVIQFESGLNVGQMCNITALLTNFIGIHPQSKRNYRI